MLASRMSAAAAEDYEAVLAEAEELAANGTPPRRSVERLRRELRRIDDRDHFKPEVRDRAHRAVRALDRDRVSDQEPSVR